MSTSPATTTAAALSITTAQASEAQMSEAPTAAAPRPLDGITVLDLSRLLPGPFLSQMLADFGARVIKVEGPGIGDPMRMVPPFAEGVSSAHLAVNRGKQSVVLDLKHPGGKALLLRLAAKADVLLEGFRPGVMDRLGLGYERLREENPRLIYCAITGYGQTGPLRAAAGHDLNYLALSGALAMTGSEASGPLPPGVQVADLTGALYAGFGILAALRAREATGRGQFVDVSMLDSVLSLTSIHALGALYGAPPTRGRFPLSGALPNYGVYETKDGRHLAIGALEAHFWARAAAVLELPDLAGGALSFLEPGPEVTAARARVAARVKEQTLSEWVARFDGIDACVTPVLEPLEALGSAQVRARGMRRAVRHPAVGWAHQLGPAVQLSETPAQTETPPPALGEHTGAVLQDVLGCTAQEVDDLRQAGGFGV